jgi:hypothetical protein
MDATRRGQVTVAITRRRLEARALRAQAKAILDSAVQVKEGMTTERYLEELRSVQLTQGAIRDGQLEAEPIQVEPEVVPRRVVMHSDEKGAELAMQRDLMADQEDLELAMQGSEQIDAAPRMDIEHLDFALRLDAARVAALLDQAEAYELDAEIAEADALDLDFYLMTDDAAAIEAIADRFDELVAIEEDSQYEELSDLGQGVEDRMFRAGPETEAIALQLKDDLRDEPPIRAEDIPLIDPDSPTSRAIEEYGRIVDEDPLADELAEMEAQLKELEELDALMAEMDALLTDLSDEDSMPELDYDVPQVEPITDFERVYKPRGVTSEKERMQVVRELEREIDFA